MSVALLLIVVAIQSQELEGPVAASPDAAVRADLDVARDAYADAMTDAGNAVKDNLNRELERAKQKGELGTVEDLLDQRRAFLNDGMLPQAVDTRAYERIQSEELSKLVRAYDDAVREAVKRDRIEEAKLLRDELEEVRKTPGSAIKISLAKYAIVSGAGEPALLKCGAALFTNRSYALVDVSDGSPVSRYVPIAVEQRTPIVIDVAQAGRIYVALEPTKNDYGDATRANFLRQGWRMTPHSAAVALAQSRPQMRYFWKHFNPGRHIIERVNGTGPVPLLP